MKEKRILSQPIVNHKTGETREDLLAKLPIPGPGRTKETEEQKLLRKSRKQLIEEYKDALAEALPLINPVLVAKAVSGDVPAIKEVHDRVMDKAKQSTDLTTGGEKIQPILVRFLNGKDN